MEADVLGAGMAIHGADVRLGAFRHLVEHAIAQQLRGDWAIEFVRRAWNKGAADAGGPVVASAGIEVLLDSELTGVSAAISVAVARVGFRHYASRARAWQAAAAVYDKEMTKRLPALVDTLTVQAYNKAKLAGYRARGVTSVGVIAETIPPHAHVRDFDPDQERDERGRWARGSGGLGLPPTTEVEKKKDWAAHVRKSLHRQVELALTVGGGVLGTSLGGLVGGILGSAVGGIAAKQATRLMTILERHDFTHEQAIHAVAKELGLALRDNLTAAEIEDCYQVTRQVLMDVLAVGDAYDPDQPRDEHGRWEAGGETSSLDPNLSSAHEAGYLHHSTAAINLPIIRQEGLKGGSSQSKTFSGYGTGKISLTETRGATEYWHGMVNSQLTGSAYDPSKTALIRVPKDKVEAQKSGRIDEVWSRHDIPPEHLEVLSSGQWQKLKNVKLDAEVRDAYEEEPIEVGVRTAGDDRVCYICEEYADGAPYDINDVEDDLPLHVFCRCTWYPFNDKRFKHDAAPVEMKLAPVQDAEPQ